MDGLTRTDQDELGARVRQWRVRRRWTLRQLSEATGLSESFLSQFERGLTQASIASLRSITDALGIALGDLFDTQRASGARVLREQARPTLPFGHEAMKFLLTPKTLDHLEVFSVKFETGGSTGPEQYTHGDSEELLLVVDGAVKLELEHDVFLLERQDSIVFRSSVLHRVVNVHPGPSEVLWIISPPSH
jgi:transcriptional regulator with XRE-family HTH domain